MGTDIPGTETDIAGMGTDIPGDLRGLSRQDSVGQMRSVADRADV